MHSRPLSIRGEPDVLRFAVIALAMVTYCADCTAQSPGNLGGEDRPWLTLDAAYNRYAERSHITFAAGLTHPSWSSRTIAILQGTIGLRNDFGSGPGSPMPWRFTVLDFDRELDPAYLFDWAPCFKAVVLAPPPPRFSWHLGATLLDLDRTTAAENETRWIQARVGLVQRFPAYSWPSLDLRIHAAIGAATVRLGEAEYSSLGKRASETMTGGDLRAAIAAHITLPSSSPLIAGSIDAEARMLPGGFETRRGTIGAQIQLIGRFGCSGMGGGFYLRYERQWTQIEQNEHSLDRALVGIHLGVISSREMSYR